MFGQVSNAEVGKPDRPGKVCPTPSHRRLLKCGTPTDPQDVCLEDLPFWSCPGSPTRRPACFRVVTLGMLGTAARGLGQLVCFPYGLVPS